MDKRSAGLVGAGAASVLTAAILGGCGGNDAGAASPAPPSMFEEQQRVMKQAMEMAQRAQEMQAKHMAMMERAMREAEEGDSMPDSESGRPNDD